MPDRSADLRTNVCVATCFKAKSPATEASDKSTSPLPLSSFRLRISESKKLLLTVNQEGNHILQSDMKAAPDADVRVLNN